MQIDFYAPGAIDEDLLYYAIIAAQHEGKWLFVQQKTKDTWELPGGRREAGETIQQTACRELHEETGALVYTMREVCDYSVSAKDTGYGRLFCADITVLGPLPDLEIARIRLEDGLPSELTYPEIQPILFQRILKEIGVVPAGGESIVEIHAGNFRAWVALGLLLWPRYFPEELSGLFSVLFHSPTKRAYLYQIGDEAVGFINLSLRHGYVEGATTSPIGYVEGLYVTSPYRKQGIARKLLQKGEEWARSQGCVEMGSDTELANGSSQKFHARVGFREANRIVCFIRDLEQPEN